MPSCRRAAIEARGRNNSGVRIQVVQRRATRRRSFASGVPLYRGSVVIAAIAMLRSAHDRKTARIALLVSSAASGTATSAGKRTSKVDCASCSRRAGCVLLNGSRGDGPWGFPLSDEESDRGEAVDRIDADASFRCYARCAHSDVTDIEYEYTAQASKKLQINSWLCRREHPGSMDDGTGGWAKLLVRCLQPNIAEDVEITRTIVPTLLERLERCELTTWRLVRQLPTDYSR